MRKAGTLVPSLVSATALVLAAAACAPGYRPAPVTLPNTFRETADTAHAAAAPYAAPGMPGAVPAAAGAPGAAPAPAAPVPPDRFWRALSDSTLDRLVAEVLRANLDVQVAQARVLEARAAQTTASLDLAPQVTAVGSYTRQRFSAAAVPGFRAGAGTLSDLNLWDGGLVGSWELDLFGRVRRNVQGQGALLDAAGEDVRNVQVTLTAEVARAYFELRGAQEQLAVARQNAENQRRTFELTRERLAAGRGTAFDTERAQAQLSTTLATVPTLEADIAAAQFRIGVLVGRPPAVVARELNVSAGLPSLPDAVTIPAPEALVRRRPDVASAERVAAASHVFVGAAKAEYLPRITLGGSVGFSGTTFDTLGQSGTLRYAVGPTISWPALNLGQVKASVDAARAREDQAQALYTLTVLRALQEVETALVRYRTARSRLGSIGDAAAASARAAELARLRFAEGVADFLQVLDAERTQLDAQRQLAQTRTEAATAYVTLYQALGGEGIGGEGGGQ